MAKLEGLDVNSLIELFDTNTSEFRFNKTEPLKKAFEQCEKTKDERLEDIRKDILLFDLFVQPYPKDRFNPMVVWNTPDGKEMKYPDISRDFSEESVTYYKKRAEGVSNPLLVARYSDFIWFYKKEVAFARVAVSSYLQSSNTFFDNGWDGELADALTRALIISLTIKDDSLIKESIDTCKQVVFSLLKVNRPRYILEITELVIKNYERLKSLCNLADYVPVFEEAISLYRSSVDDSFHLQRGFLSLLLKLFKIVDESQIKPTQLRIVQSSMEEGDWKLKHYPNGGLVAHSFYQQALKVCQDFGGFEEEAETIKKKIKGLETQSVIKYKEIKTEVTIPTKVIENYLEGLKKKTTKEVIQILCADASLIPSYAKAKENAESQAREFVLQHIVPVQRMKGNLCVKTIQGDEAKLEFETIRNFVIGYKMTVGILLSKVFDMIEKEHPDFKEQFIEFLKECPYIKKERLEIIEAGLKSYSEKNYISSFHVLVFQTEGLLRDMLEGAGVPTFSLKANEMQVKLFSNIISLIKQIRGIDQDLVHLVEIFLGRAEGDNLRNDTAHALCDSKSFSRENNILLLLIIIKLAGYWLEKSPSPSTVS